MDVFTMYKQELRVSLRQRSFYIFLLLYFLMVAVICSIQGKVPGIGDYSNMSATLMNVILYLLPLVSLLLGSFSMTQEKEDGSYLLLLSYPLSAHSYILGKYLGQFTAQWIVVTFSFSLTGLLNLLFSFGITLKWFFLLYTFSVLLLLCFLATAFLVGALTDNRWQALMTSIMIWFIFIMVWPLLLLSIVSFLPYDWIQPLLSYATLLNPAECLRIILTIQLGGGAVFGQPYYSLMNSLLQPLGIAALLIYCLLFIAFYLGLSVKMMKRRRAHG